MDIHSAAASGVLAVVRARVEAEPSAVHSEDVDRTRPLTYEAVEGQRHIVEYLLDNGAEVRVMHNLSPLIILARGIWRIPKEMF